MPVLRLVAKVWDQARGWVGQRWRGLRSGPLTRVTDGFGRLFKGIRRLQGPRLVLVLGLVFIVFALVAGFGVYRLALGPVRPGSTDSEIVAVPYGHSTTQIAVLLETKGLIRSARAFRLWTVVSGTSGGLHAGEYSVGYGLSTPQIVGKMVRGQVVLHPVTIPEGYNITQIAALLEQRGFADQTRFYEALRSAAASGTLPSQFASSRPAQVRYPLEGYLFPDTYHVYRGITEGELVRLMVGRFRAALPPALEERARELKLTPAQAITLASIIEREARVAEERPIISGVFHNRLRIGMKLDADPTVRYAMPDPTRPITSKELAINSPYNTYVNAGLPPGPICSPGRASIEAALYPAQVNYFYFVARPDGSHAFSKTFAEHLRNVALYIK